MFIRFLCVNNYKFGTVRNFDVIAVKFNIVRIFAIALLCFAICTEMNH